ncbi:MAG: sigma-70 family RNA polymerase sigma factor [Phycisphaerae bacterium]
MLSEMPDGDRGFQWPNFWRDRVSGYNGTNFNMPVNSKENAETRALFHQGSQKMGDTASPIDAILNELAAEGASADAASRLVPGIYAELRRLAATALARERSNHTLQTTALVHEAYLRLVDSELPHCSSHAHFMRIAARIMRHILIDHHRRRAAEKRGGGEPRLRVTEVGALIDENEAHILDVDDALQSLFAQTPEKARVVELRVFGGCTIEETAEALGISTATVERHWRFARAWLKSQLSADD